MPQVKYVPTAQFQPVSFQWLILSSEQDFSFASSSQGNEVTINANNPSVNVLDLELQATDAKGCVLIKQQRFTKERRE